MGITLPSRLRPLALATAAAVLASVFVGVQPAVADTVPVEPTTPTTVSADALPTVQINGVVWTQKVVGNVVYVGGNFSTAQPAGSAPGANTVPRSNILAYDIRTGVLINSFAPILNGQVKAIEASPDGSRIYIGGAFTTVNGVNKYRVAALDPVTGQVITSFTAGTNAPVSAIAATATTVYLGGAFTSIGKSVRGRIAAVNASNGVETAFAPGIADGTVTAMVLSPDGQKLVVGGSFTALNGSSNPGYGLGAVSTATGQNLPWNVNNLIRNGGVDASITSLTGDADGVYGTGYTFGKSGNLEGAFRADWATGDTNWVEDCHGDTYSAVPFGDQVYVAGHPHYCGNVGGFPQTEPTWTIYRGLAFTKQATQTITRDPMGYYNFEGSPAPTLLDWYPDINSGTFTGQSQGPWSVAAGDGYLSYAGEFTQVNGKRQQGIVRFAAKAKAPNTQGPLDSGAAFTATVTSQESGTLRVSWTANADRDNRRLTYQVYRDGNMATPVYTTTADSRVWDRPAMGFVDRDLTPGKAYSYRIRATDPLGNTVIGDSVQATVTSAAPSPYVDTVRADGATAFWRLGEASGSVNYDWAGFDDQTVGTGVTRGAAGAITGDADTASVYDGTANGLSASKKLVQGPQTFSVEAWFKTTTTSGGKIVGFGNKTSGTSDSYDRHIYMANDGRVSFGVYPNASRTLTSATALNDGEWHQVVGTLGKDGMQFFVDGARAGYRSDTTSAQDYKGYWRIGGDNSWDGGQFFAGAIDDVAIYPSVLDRQQVDAHYVTSGRTSRLPKAPADSYGARVFQDNADSFWRLDEKGGTTVAADASTTGSPAAYIGGVTQGVPGVLTSAGSTAAQFDGQSGQVIGSRRISNPQTYSLELWFNSTTNRGGKLIGFGDNANGLSGNYDRHVFLRDDGRLTYGTWTGQENTVTSSGSYTDGRWHQVVATQSSDGLKLYVDGALIGTNPQTQAQAYDGYWKLGGDPTWGSSSPYVAATIDEAAVYSTALSASTVSQHYALGQGTKPNQAPTAAFDARATDLSVAVDASASADADGSVASYAWQFGDGATASGATATHAYAAAGTYTVTLTVTDDKGATAVKTSDITVVAPRVNQAPTAAFTPTTDALQLAVDGRASADADGRIASYAWTFGDGSSATGAEARHAYAAAGTYTVGLTVTDDEGLTGTSTTTVTVAPAPPVNQAPTASFTTKVTDLGLAVDGSASADADGTIASYAWTFGDGATATGATASHAYAAAGTYAVRLTVTDDTGATATTVQSVVATAPVAVDAPPTASFTSTVSGSTVSVDASASADAEGPIASYAWDFGDGTTAVGRTATRVYAAPGTYTVALKVTDGAGAIATSTATVTIAAAPVAAPIARDAFARTVSNGLGTADVGGAWTRWGTASNLSVRDGAARLLVPAPGVTSGGTLDAVKQTAVDMRMDFSVDKAATGGGTFVYAIGRRVSNNNEYRAVVRLANNGTAAVSLVAHRNSGTATTIANEVRIPGTIAAGTAVSVRTQVTGTSPTTIRAKVWIAGTAEPTAWNVQATDSSAGLQAAGGLGVLSYVSGSATNAPQTVTVRDLTAFAP
ncbi:PKD domain-containing protein [Clavibacter lycopersici]|uniref:PKD domain-containing protein n=2 Tax=Clavibacter lycopersici TaxID=2301718 RepID=A0A399T6Y6_9MICO|nr:PKD domain-containing protein [Clavibacter lycopersici]RIJ51508.1 PKD domain-containing protein [Clavibacter lycopersici]